ncbi:MAG: zinc ABC transporter ATP-binding protein ZnuC [Rhodospirillales bacterium]
MSLAALESETEVGTLLLEGQGLSFAYEGSLVLEDIDIALRRGEIVTLVGPNGAGKSTLAKLLVGVLKTKTGRLTQQKGLRVGYVPQALTIDATLPLTVVRFMALGAARKAAGTAALQRLGIANLANRQLRELSGGQRQRVLLARALAREPDLLVLDEPGQGLDLDGQAELSRLLIALRDQGCSVLLVSHDLSLVLSCTDRVLCIDRTVCCAGAPDSVVGDPAYHRTLGPQAAQVLALYRQRQEEEKVVTLSGRDRRV